MAKFAYEISYTDRIAGVINANNEADAEYQIENEYDTFEDFNIEKIEEVVD